MVLKKTALAGANKGWFEGSDRDFGPGILRVRRWKGKMGVEYGQSIKN